MATKRFGHAVAIFITLLSTYLLTSGAFAGGCRRNWRFFNGKCYGLGTSSVSWGDAMTICKTYGGKLAEPESSTENTFLKSFARDHRAGDVWIGGTDTFHEGVWEWASTGRTIYSSIADWESGEPSSVNGEDCILLSTGYGFRWNDAGCGHKCAFICEAGPK